MKKIIAFILVMLLLVSLVFTGCSTNNNQGASSNEATQSSSAAGSDADFVKGKGVLMIGVTDFEPMDYKDESGQWVGFDADLAKEFAKYLGIKCDFTEIDWDNKVLELNGKNIDCVWNGMTLTEEVTSSMDCSTPYCNNAQIVVVKTDVADKYQDAASCKDLTFAVESGSAGQEQAEANGFKFNEVKDQATALMEVASGTSDAAIIDSLMAAAMVGEGTSYEDLTYTAKLNSEEYGVGFRQGSDLVAEYEKFFKQIKEDGTLAKIAEQYGLTAALID